MEAKEFPILDEDVLVFIDETGDVAFKGHTVFAIGGIVTYGAEYQGQVRGPWEAIKARHGLAGTVLHASDRTLPKKMVPELGEFFSERVFGRFAAAVTPRSRLARGVGVFEASLYSAIDLARPFIARFIDANPVHSIVFVFEHSHAHEPLLRKHLLRTQIRTTRGPFPTHVIALPKRTRPELGGTGEPGLEVADFVMSAAYARNWEINEKGAAPSKRKDILAVFEPPNAYALGHYAEVDELTSQPNWGAPGRVFIGSPQPPTEIPRGWIGLPPRKP
jgi:hypothetical protein